MVTGLHSPSAVRYDTATDRLFFLEAGTTANLYKDGTLNMIDMRATVPPAGTAVTRLLTGLEYPRGLWPASDRVYFTETAGRNTVWGGKVCLDVFSLATAEKTVLVNNPENSDAVVVARSGSIYLTSYYHTTPGEQGKVSVVDPATNVETHILDIGVASKDMYIDAQDNIFILGSSDLSTTPGIYYLAAGNYLNPSVLKSGLGRTWCISEHEGYVYYSDLYAIRRFPTPNGPSAAFLNKPVSSISFGGNFLYYVDFFDDKLRRVDLLSGTDEIMVTGLHSPSAVRYDTATDRLFFLEAGTTANHYKDGTLNMIDMRATVPPAGTARLYDVDFSTPPHTVGLPPVAGAGDPPRNKVSEVTMGAPTVVSNFGELTDQPLLFDTYGHVPQQIRLRLDDLPASTHYCLDVDIVIGSMQDQIGFSIDLDVPQVRTVNFWSDEAVRVWPSPVGTETIGHYTFGTKTHVRVEIDLETDRWNISLDGVLVYSESLEGATELRSIRFTTKTISSEGERVAIDNIVVESSSAAATPLRCTDEAAVFFTEYDPEVPANTRLSAVLLDSGIPVVIAASGLNQPIDVALNPTETIAYVVEEQTTISVYSGRLSAVDIRTGTATVVATALARPRGIALNCDGTVAYVVENQPTNNGKLRSIDLVTGAANIVASGLKGPRSVDLNKDATIAYVTTLDDGRLSAIDLRTHVVRTMVSGLNYPTGVAVSYDESRAWVTENLADRLTCIDLASCTISYSIPMKRPRGVALNARSLGSRSYIEDDAYVTQLPLDGDPHQLVKVHLLTGTMTTIATGLRYPGGVTLGCKVPAP